MPDTLAGVNYQGHGLLADAHERYDMEDGTYLLPIMPGQRQRTRAGLLTKIDVHPSFGARPKTRHRGDRRRSDRQSGVEQMLTRAEGRHVFAGVHNYRDEAA